MDGNTAIILIHLIFLPNLELKEEAIYLDLFNCTIYNSSIRLHKQP